MIGFGVAFTSQAVTTAGWTLLLVLAGLVVTTWVLRDVFARRSRELAAQPRLEPAPAPATRPWGRRLRSPAIWALAALIVALVSLAVVEVVLHLWDDVKSIWS
jgi:ABC-type Fe3+ transport system permease subunit